MNSGQLDENYDGDYIRIFDIYDDENSIVIDSLTGPDFGPLGSGYSSWNWNKKTISSSGNNILVEFRSDDLVSGAHGGYILNAGLAFGFSASINYSPLPSKECEKVLNITMKIIQSPNYPDSYNNNLSCKWLISVPHGSHITLTFLQFDVRIKVISMHI